MSNKSFNTITLLCSEDLADCILSTIASELDANSSEIPEAYREFIEVEPGHRSFGRYDQEFVRALVRTSNLLEGTTFSVENHDGKRKFELLEKYSPDFPFVARFAQYCRVFFKYSYYEDMQQFRGQQYWRNRKMLFSMDETRNQEGEQTSYSVAVKKKICKLDPWDDGIPF